MEIFKFLNTKPIYYKDIKYDNIKIAYNKIKKYINLPFIINIVGTNGKGSTGRFLASYLNKKNFNTIHYTSPHILKVNERIWINGKDISNKELNKIHKRVLKILGDIAYKLTYFEYLTILAIYYSSNRDFLILEAGLGGEFDATSVVKNDLTLLTTIDFDHQEFLGNSIKKIATTKIKACKNRLIVGIQKHKIVKKIAKKYCKTYFVKKQKLDINLPRFLKNNMLLAIEALKFLNIEVDINLFETKIFGRAYRKDNIIIDVGHNVLSAKEIKKVIKKDFKKVNLIYNSYKDKDYKQILKILKPVIKKVYIIDIDDNRIEDKKILKKVIKDLGLDVKEFKKVNKNKKYLVYGSFRVVERFLSER